MWVKKIYKVPVVCTLAIVFDEKYELWFILCFLKNISSTWIEYFQTHKNSWAPLNIHRIIFSMKLNESCTCVKKRLNLYILQAVSENNIIWEMYFDSSVNCGSILCHQNSGLFDQKHLQLDSYSYVTTIPKGSFNISITELRNNKNVLGNVL